MVSATPRTPRSFPGSRVRSSSCAVCSRSRVSNEIEQRLERLFAELPGPDPELGERALARALDVLPARSRRGRRSRRLAILVAAVLVLLAVAAGALAAAGALHVSFGQLSHRPIERQATASAPQLQLPRGAAGIAVVVDGRLWLTTRGGLHLQGLPVSSAALSPHALYVAVGIGDALVAMAPDGRRAWSHPTAGRVVSIAWASDGLRIAYIVRQRGNLALHLIEGNGGHDSADRSSCPLGATVLACRLAGRRLCGCRR